MTSQQTERHPADSHDMIQVRGARENNLADISLDIPKRRLTVFTGVSGSGKSFLVFGTIAAESRRLINETYTAFLQSSMPALGRPDVDALHNLSAAIIVDQERMAANARSTVGTATDAYTMLRIIFSRPGEPRLGPSSAFSFNMPAGRMRGEAELERGDGAPISREVTLSGGMCPGAGAAGGTVCYAGDVAGLRRSGTLTGEHLDHRTPLRERARQARGRLAITGATLHNLKDVSVDIPLGVLTVVTGVAG